MVQGVMNKQRSLGRVGPVEDKVHDKEDSDDGADHPAHTLAQLLRSHHVQFLDGCRETCAKVIERVGLGEKVGFDG